MGECVLLRPDFVVVGFCFVGAVHVFGNSWVLLSVCGDPCLWHCIVMSGIVFS